MKKMKNFTKMFVSLALVNFSFMSVMAADITSGSVLNQVGGGYGADLRDVTGATVTSNGTYANITNIQKNSTLNWNTLNTAPGQTLNYNMSAGQTSLNRVVGTAPSTFAGNLTSNGGRVIIANPNGMIFENGSYTNVDSLMLTTHDIVLTDSSMELSGTGNATIQIGSGYDPSNLVVMKVAKDLNIVSNNIDINNAQIFAGKANLVTTDGVTYVVSGVNANINSVTNKGNNLQENGNVNIENASFDLIKDEVTGKLLIVSRGNTNIANTVVKGNLTSKAIAKNELQNKTVTTEQVSDTTKDYVIGVDEDPANMTAEQIAQANGRIYKTVRTIITDTITEGDLFTGKGDFNIADSSINGDLVVAAKNITAARITANSINPTVYNDGLMRTYRQVSRTTTTNTTDYTNGIIEELITNQSQNQTALASVTVDETYNYDNDRKKFGNELDTVFQRRFTPKGFAASDNDIQSRMNDVKSNAKSGKGNSIIITKKFITDVEE